MSDSDSTLPDGLDERQRISLCETLDRVLNKGVFVKGEIIISVANVDLVYLGLQLVLTSVETAMKHKAEAAKVSLGAAGGAAS